MILSGKGTKMDTTDILKLIYPDDQIFVHNPRFSEGLPVLVVDCIVPKKGGYTVKAVPYVTAENYVRILSQACYLLAYNLILSGLVPIGISAGEFLTAMERYELYYRNLALTFHERVKKGQVFEMELDLKDVRKIHRLRDFVIFTFANKRTVISGEMSFVFTG